MAEEIAAESVPEDVPEAPKRSMLRKIIIVLLVVVLIAGGAVSFLLMNGGKDKKRHVKEESVHTVLVPFDEKFTVNLRSDDGSTHYLQVPQLQLEVVDSSIAERVEEIKPKISDRISSLLRSKDMNSMMEPGSDIKLKQDLKTVVNDVLGVREKNGVREVILPQSFIVQ